MFPTLTAADLLRVQSLPAWPAGSTLLIRCIGALGGPKGLQHPEASVRQISVDFLGLIAAHLFKDALSAADNQAWLVQFAPAEGLILSIVQPHLKLKSSQHLLASSMSCLLSLHLVLDQLLLFQIAGHSG